MNSSIDIKITGHLNEPIRGLLYSDFVIKGHEVYCCTELEDGFYQLLFIKRSKTIKQRLSDFVALIKKYACFSNN